MKAVDTLGVSVLLTALLVAGTTAMAAPISWDDPNGEMSDFYFTDGGSDYGYFGTPTKSGNRFIFFPIAFKAQDNDGTDGVSESITDRLFVTITAKPGKKITGIVIEEFGDFHIDVGGAVSVSGGLFLTNLIDYDVKMDSLESDPACPITTVGSGTWQVEAAIDLSDEANEWTCAQFVLNNDLTANADGIGANAKIQKKVASSGVIITVIPEIPEPTSLVLLALGGLALTRRRRR